MFSEIVGHILQEVFAKNTPGYAIILDEKGEVYNASADEDAAEDEE